ncbi:unnamed protein product [Schistosoma mattheei]|uniref:Uncharacterized protein n=1 Tax=Schistosoma mattheei TaxID=31246 RepID=A0A183PRE7_9TREM|nr:unnamed protein product [Schistosoma mattheei]
MWHQSLKSLTSSLSHVGRCRILGGGPRDYRKQRLETMCDMAQSLSHWFRFMHSLSSIKL